MVVLKGVILFNFYFESTDCEKIQLERTDFQ